MPLSEEQRKAASERMKAMHAAKKQANQGEEPAEQPVEPTADPTPKIESDQDVDDLKRQLLEMKENMDLMRQALLNQNNVQQGTNNNGRRIGVFEKYTVDPAAYPDPTPRLAEEPRLAPLAFKHNYELEYSVAVSSYETKTGENIKEPKFNVTLYRVVLDDQGNRVQVTDQKTGKLQDKFYIARKLIFHEDPQAAMVIAQENGIDVAEQEERLFLNEMRYLRVRDWLFDIFWPRPAQDEARISEEAIGGQIVQVYTRNSEETGGIPFDQMTSKLRT